MCKKYKISSKLIQQQKSSPNFRGWLVGLNRVDNGGKGFKWKEGGIVISGRFQVADQKVSFQVKMKVKIESELKWGGVVKRRAANTNTKWRRRKKRIEERKWKRNEEEMEWGWLEGGQGWGGGCTRRQGKALPQETSSLKYKYKILNTKYKIQFFLIGSIWHRKT